MEKLTIVSLDGHAQIPPELWSKYLDKRFHDYLPALHEENAKISRVHNFYLNRNHNEAQFDVFDLDGAFRAGGYKGLNDAGIRVAQMDREGIAAEYVFDGDPRTIGMFFMSVNTEYPMDLCHAGMKAYHHWLHDTFGAAKDRLYLVGLTGHAPWPSMDKMLAELDWLTERGFRATSLPGFVTYPGQPPLFDKYWDPFWARCEERGIPLWVHAGHGERQGELGTALMAIGRQVDAEGGNFQELVNRYITVLFNGKVFESVKPRRAMWQLMMGGVFDRFPRLKLVLNEVYGDWMPVTMRYLDGEFEKHRGELPCKRRPSEYWHSNGITSLSFPRKCEIALRHDIDMTTVAFGRDYPHPEGTWPNTKLWLRDVFSGVPVDEVKAILSGNAIRILGLDRAELDATAKRIGFTVEEITGAGPSPSPELIDHFNKRGQYLQKPEGEERIPEMRVMMREDLWRVGATA